MTLAEHAEAWTRKQGGAVPPRGSEAYRQMYERWHAWAFTGIGEDRCQGSPDKNQILRGTKK